jgi:hypothetical protein
VKKSITVIGALVLFAVVASATDFPQYETFLGFTYVRANQFNQNTGLGQSIGGFSMYGGSGQFIYNFDRWLGGVADIGAVNKPNVGIINAQDTTASYLFGPRFSYRKHSRFTPYGQVLFGAATRFVSTQVNAVTDPNTPFLPVVQPASLFPGPDAEVTARLSESQTHFAMAAGGGLDIRASKHLSFRPVAVDYVLTRFPSLSTGKTQNQNSIRYTAGVIFTFGGAK